MNQRDRVTVTLDVPSNIYQAMEFFAAHNHSSVEAVILQAISSRFDGYTIDSHLSEDEIRQMVSNMAKRLDAAPSETD